MTTHITPPASQWPDLIRRCEASGSDIAAQVEQIVDRVRTGGDRALRALTLEIEGRELSDLAVKQSEFDDAEALVPPDLRAAITLAADNIRRFHTAQLPQPVAVETMPGVRCSQRAMPIHRVGLYIPGGTAPLFSTVLMLAIPARIAGCREVILCTPAGTDGNIAPAILWTSALCGVTRVFKIGGAQAIAAMAHGTESIPRVDKIFGPGNRYVTAAKQLVSSRTCAVDMPAGPSEVLVLADSGANPRFVAADMLSQAEHGADSQAITVCLDTDFATAVSREIEIQLTDLPRREIAAKALNNSRIIVLRDRSEAISFANLYAAEHLIIQMSDPWSVAAEITAAGSVFIGPWSPESAGDYASGTNHTLPTAGWARSHSGVGIDSFMRKITFQEISCEGLQLLANPIVTMAAAEGLDAHAAAIATRLKN